ncbi:hypothetical protein QJQ45_002574 [Haematococcus lacustris]|nr:hypothetical protein QJQ45_002574 [Haematococcus lacustris]
MDTAFNEDSVASLVTKFEDVSGQHEQAGMLLWDLSAGDAMADVMVRRTPILVVLTKWIEKSLAQTALPVSEGPAPPQRELEICTGIAANLATHSSLSLLLAQHPSLLGLFRDVLLLVTDVPALCELCRLGSVALRKPGHNAWLSLLSSPAACLQLLWVAGNTLDPRLLEKSLDLLVALMHCEQQQGQQQEGQQQEGQQQEGQQQEGQQQEGQQQEGQQQEKQKEQEGQERQPGQQQAQQQQEEEVQEQVGPVEMSKEGVQEQQEQQEQEQEQQGGEDQQRGGEQSKGPRAASDQLLGPASRQLLDAGLLDCLVDVLDAAAQEQAGGGANHVTPAAVDAALRLVELVGSWLHLGPGGPPAALHAALRRSPRLLPAVVKLLDTEPSPEVSQVLEGMLVVLQSAGPAAAALLGLDLQCCLALLDCPGELPAGAVEMRATVLQLAAHALRHRYHQLRHDRMAATTPCLAASAADHPPEVTAVPLTPNYNSSLASAAAVARVAVAAARGELDVASPDLPPSMNVPTSSASTLPTAAGTAVGAGAADPTTTAAELSTAAAEAAAAAAYGLVSPRSTPTAVDAASAACHLPDGGGSSSNGGPAALPPPLQLWGLPPTLPLQPATPDQLMRLTQRITSLWADLQVAAMGAASSSQGRREGGVSGAGGQGSPCSEGRPRGEAAGGDPASSLSRGGGEAGHAGAAPAAAAAAAAAAGGLGDSAHRPSPQRSWAAKSVKSLRSAALSLLLLLDLEPCSSRASSSAQRQELASMHSALEELLNEV